MFATIVSKTKVGNNPNSPSLQPENYVQCTANGVKLHLVDIIFYLLSGKSGSNGFGNKAAKSLTLA
jgi:hypothetical protein